MKAFLTLRSIWMLFILSFFFAPTAEALSKKPKTTDNSFVAETAPPAPETSVATPRPTLWSAISGICPKIYALLTGKSEKRMTETATTMVDIGDQANDSMPPSLPYPGISTSGEELATADDPFDKACDEFFDSKGNVGPWGRTALAEMEKFPQTYMDKIPSDMDELCPRFASLSRKQRELFWLWTLKAMANRESTCDPSETTAENTGLLQLDKPHCRQTGNLLNPHENIRCGVRQMHLEMQNRSSLTVSHSDGIGGTYWAVLRSDYDLTDNPRSKKKWTTNERNVVKKTHEMIKKFPACSISVKTDFM